MDLVPLGRMMMGLGLAILVIGVLLTFADRIPLLGRLPGDLIIKKENFTFYFPLTTGFLLSLLLSAAWWLIRSLHS